MHSNCLHLLFFLLYFVLCIIFCNIAIFYGIDFNYEISLLLNLEQALTP